MPAGELARVGASERRGFGHGGHRDDPSAITLTNGCDATAAWSLGTVLPGGSAVTDRDASVCRFTFASSNDSASLRLYQADTAGTAMGGLPSSWSTLRGQSGIPSGPIAAVGSVAYRTNPNDGGGSYDRSIDGGATWTPLSEGGGYYGRDVSMASATVAWRFGNDGARRTNDAGASPPGEHRWR